jgi:hypothetical protein
MASLDAFETAEKYLQLRSEALSPAGQGFPLWYARNAPDARVELAWAYYMGLIDPETFEALRVSTPRVYVVGKVNGL